MKKTLLVAVLCMLSAGAASAAKYGPYQSELVRVLDGDTFDLRVYIWVHPQYEPPLRIRLAGTEAPELNASAACERALAVKARDRAAALLMRASSIEVTDVQGTDSFGRYLARVLVDGIDLGDLLKVEGLARPYKRGDRSAWCA